jgi:hypothetical protein
MERRPAAIPAVDVVGPLAPHGGRREGIPCAHQVLGKDVLESEVNDHHGRIDKLMGDGALVEFASVVDAVECVAAIQQASPNFNRSAPRS